MSVRPVAGHIDSPPPAKAHERDRTRLLTLLGADGVGGRTIGELRERGIQAPAQAIYELQLAGYEIDRVSVPRSDGRPSVCYRLSAPLAPTVVSAAAQHVLDDGS